MSQGDRAEWIKVAKVTIGDIPAGPFQTGCAAARRKCRFANELVPTILEESAQWAGWLRSAARRARAEWENPPVAFLPSPPEDRPLTVDEVLKMAPEIVALGRKNRAIDADVLEQFDCIIAERHRLDAIVAARKAASG